MKHRPNDLANVLRRPVESAPKSGPSPIDEIISVTGSNRPKPAIMVRQPERWATAAAHVITDTLVLTDSDIGAVLEVQTLSGVVIEGSDTIRVMPQQVL